MQQQALAAESIGAGRPRQRLIGNLMSECLTYLNGKFILHSQAAISVADAGFVWGATITDRLRTFRQKVFHLDDHLRRFRENCFLAAVPLALADFELAKLITELVADNAQKLNTASEFAIVLFATPGPNRDEPTFGIQASPLRFQQYVPWMQHGVHLRAVVSSLGVDPGIKHRSRLNWWIAKRRVEKACPTSLSEPLFVTPDVDPLIRETPVANFLALLDEELVSPPRSSVLNGISLRMVEELCPTLGVRFVERELSLADIARRARECLLTNTTFCVAPVFKIDSDTGSAEAAWQSPQTSTSSSAFPFFHRLIAAWSERVGVDVFRQFFTEL